MADPAAEISPAIAAHHLSRNLGVKVIGRLELQATLVGTGKHDAIIFEASKASAAVLIPMAEARTGCEPALSRS